MSKKNMDEVFDDIFGQGAWLKATQAQLDEKNEDLDRDVAAFLNFPTSDLVRITNEISDFADSYGLSHTTTFTALLGKLIIDSERCDVAAVVAIKSLEVILRNLLDNMAERDGQPVRPLLEASVQRILGNTAKDVNVN